MQAYAKSHTCKRANSLLINVSDFNKSYLRTKQFCRNLRMLFVILLASQDKIEGKQILPVLPRARHLQLPLGRLVPPNNIRSTKRH